MPEDTPLKQQINTLANQLLEDALSGETLDHHADLSAKALESLAAGKTGLPEEEAVALGANLVYAMNLTTKLLVERDAALWAYEKLSEEMKRLRGRN